MRRAFRLILGLVLTVATIATLREIYLREDDRPDPRTAWTASDVREQASRWIAYYDTIALTAEQERTKTEALSSLPAPCCGDYSSATCCCSCNLAKSVWGLSHYLIAELGYDAPRVREAAREWIRITNEEGYSGNACHAGRCDRPFEQDGCGGMDPRRISSTAALEALGPPRGTRSSGKRRASPSAGLAG
ncbi:MAG: hypothetical protein ACE5JH_06135 [Acidobacteriota bacterium]